MLTMNVLLTILIVVVACEPSAGQSNADIMAKLGEIQATVNEQRVKIEKIDKMKKVLDLLAVEHLESAVDDVQFVASSYCASGQPATSLPLTDAPGVPDGVSGEAQCALYCRDLDGCKGYNHLKTAASDGTQCQLFTSTPGSFAVTTGCQYYKMIPSCEDNQHILVQQHIDGSTFFQRTWAEFKAGFGDKTGNYWLGNDQLHTLTATGLYKMRFDLWFAKDAQWRYAEYSNFYIGDGASKYALSCSGYSGTATDGLLATNGAKFSTKDSDNDDTTLSCIAAYGDGAGFWYKDCGNVFINSSKTGTWGFVWYNTPLGSGWSDWKLLTSRMTLIRK